MAFKTCCTKARRSPRLRRDAFQVAGLHESFSVSGFKWEVGTFRMERRRPRYWIGNAATGHASIKPIEFEMASEHCIGAARQQQEQ